jgi:serine/threonine-protein kinase
MQTDDLGDACGSCSPPRAGAAGGESSAGSLVGREILGLSTSGAPLWVRIERTLGEGGVGRVYAGRAADGRAVAVKVLLEQHAGDPGIAGRFAREIEHALRIRHPHVVTSIGAGLLDDRRPFLVMDRLEGRTLGALVRAEGPMTIARGLRLGAQVLAGLEAIHAAGLVHRDLSPDNVFVVTPDEATRVERAVILDLGFAHAPGVDTGDGVTADSPGSLVGTLAFMAPEQATRGRALTPQSDLFGAALLIYYALSGRIPFLGHDDRDVIVSVVRAAPVPLRRLRGDAPPMLDRVLGRALAKHPDARFASAAEMRAALDRIPAPGRHAAAAFTAGPHLAPALAAPVLAPAA